MNSDNRTPAVDSQNPDEFECPGQNDSDATGATAAEPKEPCPECSSVHVLQHAKPLVAPDGTVPLVDFMFTCFLLGIKPEGEPSSFEKMFDFESEEYAQDLQNGDLEKLAESYQDAIVRLFAILNIDPALLSGEDAFDVYLEHMPVSWLAQLASDLHSPLNQTQKLRGRDPEGNAYNNDNNTKPKVAAVVGDSTDTAAAPCQEGRKSNGGS